MADTPPQPAPSDDPAWEQGWDEHERLQRDRLAKLPFADKLAWLEEAHRVARQLEDSRKKAGKTP